jgi:hypothetical protein
MKPLYSSQNAAPVWVWKDFSLTKHYKSGRENDI